MELIDAMIQTVEQFYQIGVVAAISCGCLLLFLGLFALTALCDAVGAAHYSRSVAASAKANGRIPDVRVTDQDAV